MPALILLRPTAMTDQQFLLQRCDSKCELCGADSTLAIYSVPDSADRTDDQLMACETCRDQLGGDSELDINHWRCLNDSMWNPAAAVQVTAWRMLKRLSTETWAQDLLEMLYLDDELQQWAAAGVGDDSEAQTATKDCNGALLAAGDTVTIIKDLNVKGTSFTAKRGTSVRGISLTDNPEHIEGRVNGTRIVILTCFVKKSS